LSGFALAYEGLPAAYADAGIVSASLSNSLETILFERIYGFGGTTFAAESIGRLVAARKSLPAVLTDFGMGQSIPPRWAALSARQHSPGSPSISDDWA
jgi:hypothetical protein